MIRSVVTVQLKPDADRTAVAALQDELRALARPHTVNYEIADDLGLREGNWSFVIIGDFADEAAYRSYDLDPEHNRLRGQLGVHAEQIARTQFSVPDQV